MVTNLSRQAVVKRHGLSSEVLAAARMLLASPEWLIHNVTRTAFEQPAEAAEEAYVMKVCM